MKLLFVVYSRTGFSERAAQILKDALSSETMSVPRERAVEAMREKLGLELRMIQVRTPKKLGFLKAALQSLRKHPALIEDIKTPPRMEDYDAVVVCGPIWANGLCSPLRAFFLAHTGAKRLFAVHCHSSSQGYPAVTQELEALAGCPCLAALELCTTKGDAIRGLTVAFAETVRAMLEKDKRAES